MKTKLKNKKVRNNSSDDTTNSDTQNSNFLKDALYKQVQTDGIEFSPLNYRKYISENALQQFAEELKQHGIVSSLILRPLSSGRYELVAGERRLRAARLAGLATVPAAIVNLSDDQVIEIQLAENLQREDPHPMHEAHAIGQMQRSGKSVDEIAARLGKSKQFVYTRTKLLSLNDPFQEMVFADAISLQDAIQIATLSEISQSEFYTEHCSKWKKDKNFRLYNLDYYLNQYRYDLKQAPFNTRDKNLVPEVGACNGCASNTATYKTLFPEYAKQAICSNKECYNNKCSFHFVALLRDAISMYQPVALIYNNQLTELAENVIALVDGAVDLPRYNYHEISILTKPNCPDKDDYACDDPDNVSDTEEEFKEAMDNYYSELEAYNLLLEAGHYKTGLLLDNKNYEPVYFSLEKTKRYDVGSNGVTAKEVQAAIKSGKVTPQLLEAEIQRMRQKENRAQELDAEKVQLNIHKRLSEFACELSNNNILTHADVTGAKFLIYQSLDYHARQQVRQILFPEKEEVHNATCEEVYEQFKNLTEQQFTYLVRIALCSKSDSNFPKQDAGFVLYRMAQAAGIPVGLMEEEQKQKAIERSEKLELKIKELQKKIGALKPVS